MCRSSEGPWELPSNVKEVCKGRSFPLCVSFKDVLPRETATKSVP